MLWPFYEDINDGQVFLDAKQKLTDCLANFPPFTITFSADSFSCFGHKKKCTMWLKPLNIDDISNTCKSVEGDHKTTCFKKETSDQDMHMLSGMTENIQKKFHIEDVETKHGIGAQSPTELSKVMQSNDAATDDSLLELPQLPPDEGTSLRVRQPKKEKVQVPRIHPERPHIPFHSQVCVLQKKLEEEFPQCSEVGSISEEGFKPHLTLGQFPAKNVEKCIESFQSDWKDITFEVKEIYLISREDFEDPFHIRQAIPLGCKRSDAHK